MQELKFDQEREMLMGLKVCAARGDLEHLADYTLRIDERVEFLHEVSHYYISLSLIFSNSMEIRSYPTIIARNFFSKIFQINLVCFS